MVGWKFALLFVSLAVVQVLCSEHEVGGKKGWMKPDGSEYDTYNEWAQKNRFKIGDQIVFKYTNDSVLLVTNEDYTNCIITNPITKFEDGNTIFAVDHSGFYYFISGQPGHCEAGQKMIADVMGTHHLDISTPTPSPAAGPTGSREGGDDGWNSSPSQTNSGNSLDNASCFFNLLMGILLGLYVFMQ